MLGLYAGSFDPPHLGHVDIAEAAAARCSRLWVAAVGNPSKSTGMFNLNERRGLLENSFRHIQNIEVLAYEGLLVRLAQELGVDVIFRGASRGFAVELQMASMNEQMSGLPTLFVPAAARYASLSSQYLRAVFEAQGATAVRDVVPEAVYNALMDSELGTPQ